MSYVIFGLNVPLLGMNRTCLVKIIHVWQKSHMFGKNHTCLGKITHVWNLPLNKTSSKWLEKSTHVWEKPLSINILMKWENQTCVDFIKHLPNTKVCAK